MERTQKILLAQLQLNLLQQYGVYGYEVLEELRDKLKLVNNSIEEYLNEEVFEFSYKGTVLCRFHWQNEDMISVVLFDKIGERTIEFAHEYKKEKKIEWTAITTNIRNYIRELEEKQGRVMIKEV